MKILWLEEQIKAGNMADTGEAAAQAFPNTRDLVRTAQMQLHQHKLSHWHLRPRTRTTRLPVTFSLKGAEVLTNKSQTKKAPR